MDAQNVIGAFSEEQAAALANASRYQLREWDRIGILKPGYGSATGLPYGRIYSFRDLVSLRVLGQLRNSHRISPAHLRETFAVISRYSDTPWASLTLQVLGRKIVIVEAGKKREVVGGQLVLDLPLRVVIRSLKKDIAQLSERSSESVGVITHGKFISQNVPVIAGTRIPVDIVQGFSKAGYSPSQIIREYPDLTEADVAAALAYRADKAA